MARKINNTVFEYIKKCEGLELSSYYCSAGKLTIGYGHTSEAGAPTVVKNMKITKRQAEVILKRDLNLFERIVEQAVKVPLSENQFSALVSFTFNVGGPNFQSSTLLEKLNGGDYKTVPAEMMRWVKAKNRKTGKHVTMQGLANRRQVEGNLWKRGGPLSAAAYVELQVDEHDDLIPSAYAEIFPDEDMEIIEIADASGGMVGRSQEEVESEPEVQEEYEGLLYDEPEEDEDTDYKNHDYEDPDYEKHHSQSTENNSTQTQKTVVDAPAPTASIETAPIKNDKLQKSDASALSQENTTQSQVNQAQATQSNIKNKNAIKPEVAGTAGAVSGVSGFSATEGPAKWIFLGLAVLAVALAIWFIYRKYKKKKRK